MNDSGARVRYNTNGRIGMTFGRSRRWQAISCQKARAAWLSHVSRVPRNEASDDAGARFGAHLHHFRSRNLRIRANAIRLEILMKNALRIALLPLGFAALAALAPSAQAARFADAALAQAGGAPPAEMDLLGSPQGYGDPYGAPATGRGGQRGPITNAQTTTVSPTDKLIAQQNGYVGNPAGGARLKRGARPDDGNNMNTAQGAAATLYPTPAGLKPPAKKPIREIYKSPY
jgi:hypothetical protein